MRNPVLRLAGIRCGAHVDVQVAGTVDGEGMHRMIAGQWHAGQDGRRRARRRSFAALYLIADDAVIDLGVEGTVVQRDPGATMTAARHRFSESLNDVGMSVALRILEGNQETARRQS